MRKKCRFVPNFSSRKGEKIVLGSKQKKTLFYKNVWVFQKFYVLH